MGVWESYVIEAGLSGLLTRVGGQSDAANHCGESAWGGEAHGEVVAMAARRAS